MDRKVWAIKWQLSDGTWVKYYNLSFVQCMSYYVPLWGSGVRSMVVRRVGCGAFLKS